MPAQPLCCLGRREFLARVPAVTVGLGALLAGSGGLAFGDVFEPRAARPQVNVRAAVVRREDYGLMWPGRAYDGVAAERQYTEQLRQMADEMGVNLQLNLRSIHTEQDAADFVAKLKTERPDGVVLIILDRHGVAWPTAHQLADTDVPAIFFAPLGTAFAPMVLDLDGKPGTFVVSGLDFERVRHGLQMVKAWRQLQETRLVVLRGNERGESRLDPFGTTLITIPGEQFAKALQTVPADAQVKRLADDWMRRAKDVVEPSPTDVQHGIRCYIAGKQMLEAENGHAITMDCLGLIGRGLISTPCLGWCMMLDEGTTAVCEADRNAARSHMLVRYLFNRPGYMANPVPDTSRNAMIGSHCVCSTKLRGYDQPSEPYLLRSLHGGFGCAVQVLWQPGQRITFCYFTGPKQLLIHSGTVLGNAGGHLVGGCRTQPIVSLDGVDDVTAVKGHHQVYFYGDHARDLRAFCDLYGIEVVG